MLGAAHACANPLTARYDITHGLALAMILPHVVRWNAAVAMDQYAALLRSAGRAANGERCGGAWRANWKPLPRRPASASG